MNFHLVKNQFNITVDLEKVARAAFSVLGDDEGELELIFVDDYYIRELNHKYRKLDLSTDVLSFKIDDSPLIGQVFICYNIAKLQAKEYKTSLSDEIVRLLIHGIAHIYGYDHIKNNDKEKMEQVEKQIKERIENA